MSVLCTVSNRLSKKSREHQYKISNGLDGIHKDHFIEILDDYDSIIRRTVEMLDDKSIVKLILNDPDIIVNISNPTHEMQIAALVDDYYLVSNINNITETNLIYAICKSEGYVFSSAPTHCQTIKIIKMMVFKYIDHIEYNMIYPPLLLEPSLKKELEELKIKELGEI